MLDPRTGIFFSVGTLAIVFDQPGALFALFALVALSVAEYLSSETFFKCGCFNLGYGFSSYFL